MLPNRFFFFTPGPLGSSASPSAPCTLAAVIVWGGVRLTIWGRKAKILGKNFKLLLFFWFLSSQKSEYHFFGRLGTPGPMVVVPGRFGPSRVLKVGFSLNQGIGALNCIG